MEEGKERTMQNAHHSSEIGTTDGSVLRTGFGWALGAIAVLLTLFAAWGSVDLATHDYIGGEVAIVQALIGTTIVLATMAWVGAIALIKSGRDRSRHSSLLSIGLVVAILGAIAVSALPVHSLWAVPLGVIGVGLVMSVVGAIRM